MAPEDAGSDRTRTGPNPMATKASLQDGRGAGAQDAAGSAAGWAWFGSLVLLTTAAALAIAPRAVHSAAPTVAELARMGLTWPLLAGLGVVVAAVATTARRTTILTAAPLPAPAPQQDPPMPLAQDPLAREIAAELARVRGGLHDLRIEFVYVKDVLSRLQQTAAQSDAESDHDSEAAIFRLAASLDQLGGRIEHELCSQRTWMAETLESHSRSQANASSAIPPFADPYAQGFEGPTHEIDLTAGFIAGDDDVHVEVVLDEEPSWQSELGVLDEPDQPRAPLAHGGNKTSPSGRPTSTDGLLGDLHYDGNTNARVAAKIAQLRELLSDPAVQRALEAQAR